MAQKILVLGMLLSLHSLGIIFASLFTYKWNVDSNRDVGVFGICEYFNSSSINKLINNPSTQNRKFNNVSYKVNTIPLKESKEASKELDSLLADSKFSDFFDSLVPEALLAETSSNQPEAQKLVGDLGLTSAEPGNSNKFELALKPFSGNVDDAYSLLTYARTYQKCYQLLWPESDDAFEYLSSRIFLNF